MSSKYERFMNVLPGYDCIASPCGERGCGERPGAGHGIRAEKWYFGIIDREAGLALSLDVSTTKYPATVSRESALRERPSGGMICMHVAFPVEEDDIREGRAPDECDLLGKCYRAGCGALIASEVVDQYFVEKLGIDGQSEKFWARLAEIFESWSKSTDIVKARTRKRCECCNGSGIVTVAEDERP